MQVQAYLSFDGRCEEALEFYKRAVGAQVQMLVRMKDSPEAPPPDTIKPGNENKIMHTAFTIGETTLMASDGYCTGKPTFAGISLSLLPKDVPTAEKLFNALADGGKVTMPLTKTFWSPGFGMLTDRFGVSWMVSVVTEQ
jgi:PhnB protein